MYEITKMYGFLVPANKSHKTPKEVKGKEIAVEEGLHKLIGDLFNLADEKCNIEIKFTTQKMENGDQRQENEFRKLLLELNKDFSLENSKKCAEKLSKVTDNTSKESLLFLVKGTFNGNTRLFISRIPAETGITVINKSKAIDFDVKEDVFIKNSKKYKAVYYDYSDEFNIGYAIDKQIQNKEVSDYWLQDFLNSELNITAARASKEIADAFKKVIKETDSQQIVAELTAVASLIQNANGQMTTVNDFYSKFNLSEDTKNEVNKFITRIGKNVQFSIDAEEFNKNFSYKLLVLDSGAIAGAYASDFDTTWHIAEKEPGYSILTTEGKIEKTKITNKSIGGLNGN